MKSEINAELKQIQCGRVDHLIKRANFRAYEGNLGILVGLNDASKKKGDVDKMGRTRDREVV